MRLHSTSFNAGEEIPQRYGKRAENVSPHLVWDGPPSETRSFALTVIDHHPVANEYVHWIVVDIPASVTELDEDAARRGLPSGAREVHAYEGPFPPSGTHEYDFMLYALDSEKTDINSSADEDAFLRATEGHVLASAQLLANFTRQE
ncbi:MAG TPA: YbhB/YbcL family Raf kinase inhibitor-like protein [Glaciibacter sp.]|nr:YbhB/YbcL family Raf kinase inhibitor-like protein [Glaciibacter sp.]